MSTEKTITMTDKKPSRIFDLIHHQRDNYPLDKCLTTKIGDQWVSYSTESILDMAYKVSRALINMGVKQQDKIAILSSTNRFEWNVIDLGILMIGAVNVPVYPTISSADYNYIFNDSEVKYCFVSDMELFDKVNAIIDEVASLKEIFIFEKDDKVRNWTELLTEGEADDHQAELEARMTAVKNSDLATLIYTSGTTGVPKGVMLSHNNLVSNVLDCQDRIPVANGASALSFLPVCHVFERVLTYIYYYNGIGVYFAESIEKVGDNIREIKPDIFSAVPRLLEKVYDKIIAKGAEQTGIKKALFFWAVDLVEDYDPLNAGGLYGIKLGIARKLIFSKWQAALGGNIKAIVSGGAALNPRLNRVFSGAGLNVQEGYGLTETSPIICVNGYTNEYKRIGTVGQVIHNVELKIAEDGEVLCKGPNVMMGYYNQPEKTAEVLQDGWFHTGDIGEMVEGKFLRITDRKKEMFKTSGGKYIAPQIMENKFKESRFIEQIMIIGEGEKFPSAIIQLDFEFVKAWCKKKGIKCSSNEEIVKNEAVRDRVFKDILELNKNFGSWEQVKKVEYTSELWTVDNNYLTPKLSLKRRNILKSCQDQYEEIYGHRKE